MFIDFHVDTLMVHQRTDLRGDLYRSDMSCVDIERMRSVKQLAQFFAIFLVPLDEYAEEKLDCKDYDDYIDKCVANLKKHVAKYPDEIGLALSYKDYLTNEAQGKTSAFLTIEDGLSVYGSFEKLRHYYDLGIRLITLTWNFENCFGYPNSFDPEIMQRGLKQFGKEAISVMEDMGIIVDVSHLSDGGFYDVAKLAKKPFIASHSNARSLTDHPRNLTDDMIRVLASKGGVAGLNFAPAFLADLPVRDIEKLKMIKESRIVDMIRHLDHMKNVGGEDFVVLGSDLDGIGGQLEIGSIDKMPILFEALSKHGWTQRQIDKLAFENAKRFLSDVL